MDRHTARLKEMAIAARNMVADRGLDWLRAEVVLIIDVSTSMRPMYEARLVQELANQLLALGISFDDDGMIPAYAFGSRCRHLRDLTVRDFHGYVDREVIRSEADYQDQCHFAPAIDDVCAYYFPEDWRPVRVKEVRDRTITKHVKDYAELSAPRAMPVFAIVVTGGDCQDQAETADLIRQSSRFPIFFHFVGLSAPGTTGSFPFLKQLDKLGDTYVDNCGFFEPRDVSDARALTAGLLNELPDYLHSPMVQLMVKSAHRGGLTTRGKRRAPEPPPPADPAVPAAPVQAAPGRSRASLADLRARLADVEWAKSSLHGSPAPTAKPAPKPKAPPQPTRKPETPPTAAAKTLTRPRRQRPRTAFRTDTPMASAAEGSGVQDRIAQLRAELAALEAKAAPGAAPTPPVPKPRPKPRPKPKPRISARPAPRVPTPAPVIEPIGDPEDDEATEPGAGKESREVQKLRARLRAHDDDDATGII